MSVDANKVSDPLTGNEIQLNKNWDNLIGNIRYNYQITPKQHSVYIGVSQGFRAPNLSDLTRFDSARSNEFETPSIDLKPEHYISVDSGLKYTPLSSNWWLNTEVITFAKADKLSTQDKNDTQRIPQGGTPGYTIWALSTGFEISTQLLLGFQINNILDKNYRVHGSGQNEAGRNFIGSVSYSF